VFGIFKKFNVYAVGTTDNPIDSLEYHEKMARTEVKTRVLPCCRASDHDLEYAPFEAARGGGTGAEWEKQAAAVFDKVMSGGSADSREAELYKTYTLRRFRVRCNWAPRGGSSIAGTAWSSR
jgi:glucuronate isomerase